MKRAYRLMAFAGFLTNLALILLSYFVSGSADFVLPQGLSSVDFILRYYVLSLIFFAIITIVQSGMRPKESAHGLGRRFTYSLLGFSIGSVLAAILFLLFVAFAWTGIHPPLF